MHSRPSDGQVFVWVIEKLAEKTMRWIAVACGAGMIVSGLYLFLSRRRKDYPSDAEIVAGALGLAAAIAGAVLLLAMVGSAYYYQVPLGH